MQNQRTPQTHNDSKTPQIPSNDHQCILQKSHQQTTDPKIFVLHFK